MDKLFLTVLNMSATGAFVIAAVMLARLPLKKAPKWISYALWAVAAFRLVCPFTFESVLSLVPRNVEFPEPSAEYIVHWPPYSTYDGVLQALPLHTADGITDTRTIYELLAPVWLAGIAIMLIYSVVSIVILRRGLRGAALAADGVYEAENLKTPFVIGLFRPRIYIPSGLSGEERRYIVLHERTHIRRRDHIVKMFAYYALCLHWFNPLAWAAFWLCGADMEMSCDERVLKELGGELRCDYSMSLVRAAANRRIWNGSPLAFGEGGMKERVKNVLNFRKPSRIIVVAAVALAAVLTIGFAVNGAPQSEKLPEATISFEGKSAVVTLGDSEHIPYVELGSTISIDFGKQRPAAISVIEVIANADGSRRYNEPIDKTLEVEYSGSNLATFRVEKNFSDGLSSNTEDYLPGNAFRWYRIICNNDGRSTTEYGLWLRTDPAFIMVPIGIIPDSINVPDAVLAAAVDWVSGDYEGSHDIGVSAQKKLGAEFDNWRIDYIEHAYRYNDMSIEVYRFEWRVHTTTPDKVAIAGGADLDADAWLLDTYPHSWYLIFNDMDGELVHLVTIMENGCAPGDEMFTQDMLNILDTLPVTEAVQIHEQDPLEDIKMGKRAAMSAFEDTFVFDESGVTFTIPESVMTVNGYPVPVKIAIEVDGLDSSIGDPNYAILGGMSIEKDEIIAGSSFCFPLWNIGGKGAHFAVTFDDGETQYYSPLYEDWQRENEE